MRFDELLTFQFNDKVMSWKRKNSTIQYYNKSADMANKNAKFAFHIIPNILQCVRIFYWNKIYDTIFFFV